MRRSISERILVVGCLFFCGFTACPPPTPVTPDATVDASVPVDASPDVQAPDAQAPVDAAPASPCARACSNLAAHGCEEMGAVCEPTCQHLVLTGLTPFSAECVYTAATLSALRKCPAVRCVKGH